MSVFAGKGVAILGPFPPRPGGVSVQCATLAQRLETEGAIVTRVNTDMPALRRRGRWLLPPAQVAATWRHLRQSRDSWQVLHVHAASWWGFIPAVVALAARQGRKRLVLSYHGGEIERFFRRWPRLVRFTLSRYDALLALTPTHAAIFRTHGFEAAVMPNIAPIETFPFRPRGPLSPRLLWLRQLEPHYRPADALAIFALVRERFPAATLTLVGGGSLAAGLAKEVEERKWGGVSLPGHLAAAAIPQAYAAADIFLNTSAVDNLPLTLIEASASGLPIVSTNAGAIPDLITDGENGLLAPVGDIEALAGHILRLLEEPDLARRLSLAARVNAERFSWLRLAPRLAQAYGLQSV